MVVSCQLSVISYQLSVISYQLSMDCGSTADIKDHNGWEQGA
jgi:hypothetical protein